MSLPIWLVTNLPFLPLITVFIFFIINIYVYIYYFLNTVTEPLSFLSIIKVVKENMNDKVSTKTDIKNKNSH